MTTRLTTRLATRLATRPAVGYTPPGGGPGPGTPVISVVGDGDLLPGATISSDTSLPWLADGVQIAPASLSLELPWTVAPGAVITQPGSNALTVAAYHADAANYLNRVAIADDESLEQPVQWVWDVFFRQMADTDHPTPTAASHKIALQAGTAIPMLGARTLAGALEPLYSGMPAPTNIGFVSGDYDRATGLKGDGSSKYINLVCRDDDPPQDDFAYGSYNTQKSAMRAVFLGAGTSQNGTSRLNNDVNSADRLVHRNRTSSFGVQQNNNPTPINYIASSRHESTGYVVRANGVDFSHVAASQAPTGFQIYAFATNDNGTPDWWSSARQVMVHAGRSVDLTYMDTCLTTLISSIAAALS